MPRGSMSPCPGSDAVDDPSGDQNEDEDESTTADVPEPVVTPDARTANPVGPQSDADARSDGMTAMTRLSGPSRVESSVALSRASRKPGTARAVVVVPSDKHSEALVAAPLAGLLDDPILRVGGRWQPTPGWGHPIRDQRCGGRRWRGGRTAQPDHLGGDRPQLPGRIGRRACRGRSRRTAGTDRR